LRRASAGDKHEGDEGRPHVDISEFDDKYRYINLATFRKNGAEVKTPVWFAALDGKLYVYTPTTAGKAKRLRNSPRARVAPCDIRGNVLGEFRDTSARFVTDAALVERVYAALRKKYGWQIALLSLGARIAGKIKDRVYIEIDYAK
jgi:PPOX class probable F420-dependent enzyme